MSNDATRRAFLKTVGALALGTLGRWASAEEPRARARPPNVVLIVADDLGQECLRSYGGTSYRTPHLDALAASGMVFSNCFSTPLCAPSRLQLMTGRYPIRNYRNWGEYDPSAEPSFARLLRESGYVTAVAGKWQLCRFDEPGNVDHPLRSGFDESCLWTWIFDDGSGPATRSKYWSPWIWWNGELRRDFEGSYGPDLYCSYLLDFVRRRGDRPFLAYYPMALPHGPFTPTPQSGVVNRVLGYAPQRVRGQLSALLFPDHVAYMDHLVGRLVQRLDQDGLRETTLVLFTADNGTDPRVESRVEDRLIVGGKGRLSEPGTRVPLIASWPGTIQPGTRCEDLVDLSDFLPTLVELAGATLPKGIQLDGRSFLPQMRGTDGKAREWVYISHWQQPPDRDYQRVVRTHRWKLYGDGRLYDIASDPDEFVPYVPGHDSSASAEARRKLSSVIRDIETGKRRAS